MPINLEPSGKPLYRRIYDAIRDKIASGEWQEGAMVPTRRSLAAELHTTRDTIGKAIAELVREGWLEATAGSGTFVTARNGTPRHRRAAGSPATDQFRIGVVLPPSAYSQGPYYNEMLLGIRSMIERPDIAATFIPDTEIQPRPNLDGFVIVTPGTDEILSAPALYGDRPFVVVGNSVLRVSASAAAAIPCVDTTHRQGAYDAVRHLLDLGHERIGIVDFWMESVNHFDRLQGYLCAMADAGLPVAPDSLILFPRRGGLDEVGAVTEAFGRLIAAGRMPTAFFAADLDDTLSTLSALRNCRLAIPDDVSVIGFDDGPMFAHTYPPVTVMRQPVYEMARRAVERLLDRFKEGVVVPDTAGVELLPMEMVLRQSTRAPRSS